MTELIHTQQSTNDWKSVAPEEKKSALNALNKSTSSITAAVTLAIAASGLAISAIFLPGSGNTLRFSIIALGGATTIAMTKLIWSEVQVMRSPSQLKAARQLLDEIQKATPLNETLKLYYVSQDGETFTLHYVTEQGTIGEKKLFTPNSPPPEVPSAIKMVGLEKTNAKVFQQAFWSAFQKASQNPDGSQKPPPIQGVLRYCSSNKEYWTVVVQTLHPDDTTLETVVKIPKNAVPNLNINDLALPYYRQKSPCDGTTKNLPAYYTSTVLHGTLQEWKFSKEDYPSAAVADIKRTPVTLATNSESTFADSGSNVEQTFGNSILGFTDTQKKNISLLTSQLGVTNITDFVSSSMPGCTFEGSDSLLPQMTYSSDRLASGENSDYVVTIYKSEQNIYVRASLAVELKNTDNKGKLIEESQKYSLAISEYTISAADLDTNWQTAENTDQPIPSLKKSVTLSKPYPTLKEAAESLFKEKGGGAFLSELNKLSSPKNATFATYLQTQQSSCTSDYPALEALIAWQPTEVADISYKKEMLQSLRQKYYVAQGITHTFIPSLSKMLPAPAKKADSA